MKQKTLHWNMFLSPIDRAVLIFSTFIINLFALAVPLVTLQVYDRILAFNSVATLQVLCLGVCVIVVLDILMKLMRSSIIGWISARFEHTCYNNVLSHLMRARLKDLDAFTSGELLQNVESVAKLKSFYSGQSLISLVDLPFVLIFVGFIWYLAGPLVIVPIVLLVIFAVYASILGRQLKSVLERRERHDDRRIDHVTETLEKIHSIKMMGLEPIFQRRHEFVQAGAVKDTQDLNYLNVLGVNAAAFFTQVMMISMISIGAVMVLSGTITMGVLIACVLLSGRIMQPVQRVLSFWMSFQEFRLAENKIAGMLDLPGETPLPSKDIQKAKGRLAIKDMSYKHHPDDEDFLFKNINLTLQPGQIIALGGPPGGGKTVLLKLIAGLSSPDSGEVLVDGVAASKYPADVRPHHIGYLPSESEIFQGSIMDNLTSFRPALEKEALEICGYLGVDKVVSKLPQGYDTPLLDGPADPVTPGMKQRITIARVLVNKPRLLLFDFADRALDREGYNHLFRLLGQLKGQVSMIIVSNDRNLLHLAQDEYILENGEIKSFDDSQYSKAKYAVPLLRKELET